MAHTTPPGPADKAGNPGNQQTVRRDEGNRQSHAQEGEHFVLVDSERGLDIGDDLFSIGEVRRADRLPQHQGGNAGQSRQSADDAPDTTGSTGV